MGNIRCFLLQPTNQVARWLRRATSALPLGVRLCEPAGQHEAYTRIENGPLILEAGGRVSTEPLAWCAEDPRWPAACMHCRQHSFPGLKGGHLLYLRLYRVPASGQEVVTSSNAPPGIATAPVGAMWYDDWQAEERGYEGPDGRCVCLMTPGGIWCPDAPAASGQTWQRSGKVPHITVTPAVNFAGVWKGHLWGGELITSVE